MDWQHIYPIEDWIEHKMSLDCICEPKLDWDNKLVIHNSADGREIKKHKCKHFAKDDFCNLRDHACNDAIQEDCELYEDY